MDCIVFVAAPTRHPVPQLAYQFSGDCATQLSAIEALSRQPLLNYGCMGDISAQTDTQRLHLYITLISSTTAFPMLPFSN